VSAIPHSIQGAVALVAGGAKNLGGMIFRDHDFPRRGPARCGDGDDSLKWK
jgi:hypothetical protein